MTPLSSKRASLILTAALDHAPEDREAFLATACDGDVALLAEVRSLLAAHAMQDIAESDLDATIKQDPRLRQPASVEMERVGERIGRYKLLQEIGEGGFGTVWMAEQMEPVSRKVALKIIKLGMDTREVIARFEAERQAVAMMDHANIAKVLDAGATGKGRPFFVMELVKGIPITQFCDEAGLGTRERLALFGDVCDAINHAHQKGVIHRDIKPSNVMVTLHGDKPVVKVIDFGIAKATQGKLTDKTLFTRFEQFIGTPVYMSPEQASLSGLDIDTRSDIYALGILLYELLVGKPPFDAKTLASAGYEEMRRIIREVEPPKPSSRLSTTAGEERTQLAKARHIEPGKVGKLVEPDLDWIVMKAIDKDRRRRYETANAFALDIKRFLDDEAVSASPPSAGYQFRKFVRRNKAALRVVTAIATVLVAATSVSTWQAVRANTALADLRKTAPIFHTAAITLFDAGKYDEAFEKIGYAIQLDDANADYRLFRANLLGASHKLRDAADEYKRVLALRPDDKMAKMNLFSCEQFLTEQSKGASSLSGLVCWWKADGNTWDSAGTNHGKIKDGVSYAVGRDGQAFVFGRPACVMVRDSPVWAFGKNDFTLALWVNFDKQRFSSHAFIASDDGGGQLNKWIFWRQGGKLQMTLCTTEFMYKDLGSGVFTPVIGDWYHVAVTRLADHFTFYLNGKELSSEYWNGEIPRASAPLTIGCAEANFHLNGLMEDIRIYNRSLSVEEIKVLANP